MSSLKFRVDPSSMGFDTARLQRIQKHFDQYVAAQKLPGWLATVSRGGEFVWTGKSGYRDCEKNLEVTDDTIWRIYSMTKPIVSIAAMMLYEEGAFDLNDDAGRWIDDLREPRVFVGGTAAEPETIPTRGPVRIHHLMTQTSGLTYDIQRSHPVDEIYRNLGYELGQPKDADLTQAVHDWCTSPLLFEPGTNFHYSVGTDVLGRLIEIWSGQSLDVFLRERIFVPLGMPDTGFWCPEDKQDRLAMLYLHLGSDFHPWPDLAEHATRKPQLLSGGSGLSATAHDYQRFMTMLLRGGELDGVRLLSSRTLDLMTQNHLPGGADLPESAIGLFREPEVAGVGFGLGFAVVDDPIKNRSLISQGSFYWGGLASTLFWVDPQEDLTVSFYTQLIPSGTYPLRRELQQLVYQALVD
jgi:CubicO group peptidase (beta-lactamase class C family)